MIAVNYDKRRAGEPLRAFFCLAVTQSWFDSEREERGAVVNALKSGFDHLEGRLGVKVRGTFDDDEIMVGSSVAFPWTGYILVEVPDVEAVIAVCNLIRDTPVGKVQLWKYLRVEARIGRGLFFANS